MSEMMQPHSNIQERPQNLTQAPSVLRLWLEVMSVPILLVVGAILGGLTGFPPMSSILAVVLPLAVVSIYLVSTGESWRGLILRTQLTVGQILMYTAVAILLTVVGASTITLSLQSIFGFPPIDASRFVEVLEGNLTMYVWYMLPVVWGSAAIGEELLCRGFLQNRLSILTRPWIAVFMQAGIFALAHFYQGVTGMAVVFVLAIVFGGVYLRNGGNLVPLILAHGLIDSFAITAIYLGRADLIIGT